MSEILYYFEDLAVGMTASFTKTVTSADIVLFAGLSGDFNPHQSGICGKYRI